jgi:signal transduction histidine kinase
MTQELSNSARDRAIADECLRLMFEQLRYVTLGASFVALLLAAFLSAHAPLETIARWLALYHVMLGVRFAIALWYHRQPRTAEELRRMLPLQTLAAAAGAACWASVAFIAPRSDTVAAAVVLLWAGGLIAGGSQSMIGTPRTLLLTAAITITPLVVLALASGIPDQRYLAVVAIFYCVSVLQFGRRNLRVLRESIALRFGNLELVDRLTVEKERVERARDAAQQATEAKNQFLAAASHDIRQPLHAAFLFLGTLENQASPASRLVLHRLRASLTAAREMLDTLLETSRLDAGVVERVDTLFSAAELGQRVTDMFVPVAERKGVALALRAPAALWIRSDPNHVQRVLFNLTSNAIKYTESGVVLITFRRRRDACLVQVWDSGIGIEANALPTIFDEFKQLGNPERDSSRGIGLGLSIVRRLCRLLGTEITVRSKPGRGSVFSFTLPLGEPAVEPAALVVADVQPALGRLLVVDDDTLVREGLCTLLSAWGYETRAACDVDDARRVSAQGSAPDLVLVDYRLPHDKTALDAICAIREVSGSEIPAIIITGDTHPQRVREATALGHSVLFKPVPPEVLKNTLSEALRRSA